MSELTIERRPLYGIGTVSRLTGLKPDTLRMWERRYGLGATLKSNSGRRQYTQGDVEHLQMVAALVKKGTRIGEIAAAEKKTLTAMLRPSSGADVAMPAPKPTIAFIGSTLCDWLDQHQSCLAGVDALLLRSPVEQLSGEEFTEMMPGCDAAVLFFTHLNHSSLARARELKQLPGLHKVIIACHTAGKAVADQARREGYVTLDFPPESEQLAFELSYIAAAKLTARGASNLGHLVQARPRETTSQQLSAAAAMNVDLQCECPRHLAQLVESLATFESYSADCASDSWADAALHARIYALTAQARWLMERALQAVLDDHPLQFSEALARVEPLATAGPV
ncbi:MerR family transcriptional regulator [Parahaliea aestuarii]|uniref:MerR family transcriptional regulator n=1 Tax=Parahaliea aestuarii TaxID=1852021 RepID=A0A5C8ZZP2_9GAMM|nr:MerR family transcriptional regulator [Parahaliea aestuarii]TXS93204.1 MerR family transcriptional regulator [Parahaliea aestuarii]